MVQRKKLTAINCVSRCCIDKQTDGLQILRSPVNFLAYGFGTGLSPIAPGTFGTLPALLMWIPLSTLPWPIYLLIVSIMAIVGIWICQRASAETGQHDPGGIVWDEIVGFLVAMFYLPFSVTAMVAGFVLFRLLDIAKPWPISWVDKKVAGGLGIMLDDVLAGIATCLILNLLYRLFPAIF